MSLKDPGFKDCGECHTNSESTGQAVQKGRLETLWDLLKFLCTGEFLLAQGYLALLSSLPTGSNLRTTQITQDELLLLGLTDYEP